MRKHGFKSLYVKFVVMFMGILWLSSFTAFRIGFIYMKDSLIKNVKTQLYEKAAASLELTSKYSIKEEDLQKILANENVKVSIYDSMDEFNSDGLALTQVEWVNLDRGEIIEGKLSKHGRLPYAAFKTGNAIIAISPSISNNTIIYLKTMIGIVLIMCATIGSLLIAIAARMIVQPIKRLTAATKEVSKGNFDVKIQTKNFDEIGQLTDNFNIMTEELKNIEYLRKDFISSVSHEFKTPMTSIRGFGKLLKEGSLSKEQADEYADIIISETGRLENLSSNLLKLSSLENRAIHEQYSSFPLDEQIRRVILLLENKWSEKNLGLDLELDEIIFKGDEELMYQVWTNLITNAIKFSNKGGVLKIVLKAENGKIFVKVADNGVGIPDEDKSRIFEKFYKGDKARSNDGSGLGLSIVKKIIEMHKGTIYFESQTGKGTTFFVELKQ